MTTPQPVGQTGLSWSLRRHFVVEVPATDSAGRPAGVKAVAACDGVTELYPPDNLLTYGFDPLAVRRDHPMCKRCLRKAEKEADHG